MSDERERLSENEDVEQDENDVEAHVLGNDSEREAALGGDNALGGDSDRGRHWG